jgi:hypothetical protein
MGYAQRLVVGPLPPALQRLPADVLVASGSFGSARVMNMS